MFELGMPWWEFVLRAGAVYAGLLLLVRLTGKRSVGQFTPFDMILLILLGTAVQNSLIGTDVSLTGGLLLAATLISINYAIGWIAARSRRWQSLIEGDPVLLARDGEVFERQLLRENISPSDFEEAMRRHGIRAKRDIACAWLETDGFITLIARPRETA
jgi:uncharacterized membrane protein YcaP (DUF421 family)